MIKKIMEVNVFLSWHITATLRYAWLNHRSGIFLTKKITHMRIFETYLDILNHFSIHFFTLLVLDVLSILIF